MAVSIERQGSVAVVRFQNAERMNSFDADTLRDIRALFTELLADDDVRALVITGDGRAFSTGADVGRFHAAAQDGTAVAFVLAATAELHPLMQALHESDKPLVAAVNGVAAGGGLGLALAADARIGSDAARFAAGFFGIGVAPDGGSTWFLPRLIGTQRTRRFFFDNEVMDAQEALAVGLLDRIVPAEDLVAEAVALAERWGSWARHSRHSTKRLLASTLDTDLARQLDLERGAIASAAGTADFVEGVAAFVEKRKASFA